MAKNQVSIAINAQDNASTPLKRVTQTLNQATAEVKKATDPLKKLQNSFTNFSLAVPGIKLVADSLGTVKAKVSECVTAFAEIEKSTKQLQFAQNVNLQLKAAGKDLTQFSADMAKTFKNVFSQGEIQQAISEISFDHTYEEIEKITKVAGDLASATGMTLSQAVDTLANTMNGRLSTELKRITPELAGLDKEALASGQAIDILGEKLSGLADDMSGSTGASITAFNNTVGDLKETLGDVFSTSMTPMRNYFTELLGNLNSAIVEFTNLRRAKKAVDEGTGTYSQTLLARNDIIKTLAEFNGQGWNAEIAGAFRSAQYSGSAPVWNESMGISQDAFNTAYKRFIGNVNGVGEYAYAWEDTVAEYHDLNQKLLTAKREEQQAQEEAARSAKELVIATETDTTAIETASTAIVTNRVNGFTFGSFGSENNIGNASVIDTTGLSLNGTGFNLGLPSLQTNGFSAFGGSFLKDALSETFGPFIMVMDSFSTLNEILNPFTTIMNAMFETLDPVLDSILKPLSNMLKILGSTLGQVLIPLLEVLNPIIEAVCNVFVWLYNKVIRPVGNGIITIFNIVANAITAVANGFIWIYNAIVSKSKEIGYKEYRSLDSGYLSEINSDYVSNYGSTGSTSTGGTGASYTAARDITVNIYYNHSYVNGDAREIAVNLRNEIKLAEALGY